jgi:MFS family permease
VLGLGMAVAGPLTDAYGARWLWAGAAAIFAVASVVAWVLGRTLTAREEDERYEPMVVAGAGVPVAQAAEEAAP